MKNRPTNKHTEDSERREPPHVDAVLRAALNQFAGEQCRAMASLATAIAAAVDRDKFTAALLAEYHQLHDITATNDPSPATAVALVHSMWDAVRDRRQRPGAA